MLPFYITKRTNGYYFIRFLDAETGLVYKTKSTHSKDYAESLRIANEWLYKGVPKERINASKRKHPKKIFSKNTSSSLPDVSKISNEEALQLLKQLNARFGISTERHAMFLFLIFSVQCSRMKPGKIRYILKQALYFSAARIRKSLLLQMYFRMPYMQP